MSGTFDMYQKQQVSPFPVTLEDAYKEIEYLRRALIKANTSLYDKSGEFFLKEKGYKRTIKRLEERLAKIP